MWLFTRYGFYSVACARNSDDSINPNLVMIRARRRAHLKALQQRFRELAVVEIVTLPHRDYRYRMIATKEMWGRILNDLAQEQDWSNFKNDVARYQGAGGSHYVDALHKVWGVMHKLQGEHDD
jgi:hypothetical protein